MQLIIAFEGDPGSYVANKAHLKTKRPEVCPNCGKRAKLQALGYYSRWVSFSGRKNAISIMVRRFRCSGCRLTTSMLPDFAQPYRLVETDVVDHYLSGSRTHPSIAVWASLLDNYQSRFEARLPETLQILASVFRLAECSGGSVDQWEHMRDHLGDAKNLTAQLAAGAGITVFGVYYCHSPGRLRAVHTTPLFVSGRGPPSSLSPAGNRAEEAFTPS